MYQSTNLHNFRKFFEAFTITFFIVYFPIAGYPGAILPVPVPAAFAPAFRSRVLGQIQRLNPSRNRFLIAIMSRKSHRRAAWNPGSHLSWRRTALLSRYPFHRRHMIAPLRYLEGRLRNARGYLLTRMDIRLTELTILSENILIISLP